MEIKQTDRSIQENHEKDLSDLPSLQPYVNHEEHDAHSNLKTPTSKNLHLTTPENKNYEDHISPYPADPCKICQIVMPEMHKLSSCVHIYCKSCLSDYLTLRVQEAQVNRMPCPDHGCGQEMQEEEIKQLISPINFEKFQTFKRNSELNNNPFLRWCPQPDCSGFDQGCVNKDRLTCNVCLHRFCYYCSEPWHLESKCSKKVDKDLDQWSKKHGARFCPNCRIRVQKTVGCDHMTCSRCKFEWCWLCGEEFKMGHFSKCLVIKRLKWDKPMWKLMLMIFSGLILMILPVVVLVNVVHETDIGLTRDAEFLFRCLKKRGLVYLFAVVSGLVLIPFFYTLGPIVVGIILTYKFFKEFCCSKCARVIFSPLFGCSISPFVPFVAFIVVIGLTMAGLFFLVIKIIICIRRCVNPHYMASNTKYHPMF